MRTEYTVTDLDALIGHIQRQNPKAVVDPYKLQEELLDVLAAVGRPVEDTEFSVAFREAVERKPGHVFYAQVYRAMAKGKNPLHPRWFNGIVAVEMELQAAIVWRKRVPNDMRRYPLIGRKFASFTSEAQADLRKMALHLAHYHASQFNAGAAQKSQQDCALMELADIFLRAAQLHRTSRFALPPSPNGRFIKFANVAMAPYFPATEVTPGALSQRWKRIVEHHGTKPGRRKMFSPEKSHNPLKLRRKKAL